MTDWQVVLALGRLAEKAKKEGLRLSPVAHTHEFKYDPEKDDLIPGKSWNIETHTERSVDQPSSGCISFGIKNLDPDRLYRSLSVVILVLTEEDGSLIDEETYLARGHLERVEPVLFAKIFLGECFKLLDRKTEALPEGS